MNGRLHVFFHVCTLNHYPLVVREIASAIHDSGLSQFATLNACKVGEGDWPQSVTGWNVTKCGPVGLFEYPTLRAVRQRAIDDPTSRICYVHTKGVSSRFKRVRRHRDAWRAGMLREIVTRWRDCIEDLESCDVTGCQYTHEEGTGYRYYAGNWWWARAEYLATLSDPRPDPRHEHPRQGAELWLHSGWPSYADRGLVSG